MDFWLVFQLAEPRGERQEAFCLSRLPCGAPTSGGRVFLPLCAHSLYVECDLEPEKRLSHGRPLTSHGPRRLAMISGRRCHARTGNEKLP